MVMLGQEKIADILRDGEALFPHHWDEIAIYRDCPLDLDHARYAALEQAGVLVSFGARDKSGQLVGYAVFILMRHLHYRTTLFAMNDAVFVAPTHRAMGLGVRLIRFAEQHLKERGVKRVTLHIKPTKDWSPMAERLGYQKDDITMSKEL